VTELDHLTRLSTRAAFDDALKRLSAAATALLPAALVMADVDHFKKINDAHGHPAGDEVLRAVAGTLERTVSGKGIGYRYGGEEFAVLLPNHSCDEALAVAERARIAIESQPLSGITVTASFGVASVPTHATSAEEWLKKADRALYDAKQHGRNVVRFSGEPAPQPDRPARTGPSRKAPKPGDIPDDQKERLRRAILKHGSAYCPACNDEIPLNSHDVTTFGEVGRSFLVDCPVCGFNTRLLGPGR
jgi:diguanylate cyclase (GGDEF)-like protein